jgi:hypothetical protein
MANLTPFAQTFFVDPDASPDGIFCTKVQLCFRSKSDSAPITVQLRPTVNGFPDINKVYFGASATVASTDVNVSSGVGSDLPNFDTASTYTEFVFLAPVFLPPGEHAIVIQTNSTDYEVFYAGLGETILGTDRKVSEQPYVGSSFRSQNGSTWTAFQNEDIMFRIYRAKFNTTAASRIKFNSIRQPTANINVDVFSVQTNDVFVGKSDIDYSYVTRDIATGAFDAEAALTLKKNYLPASRKYVGTASNGDFQMFATLSSSSDWVSPVIDESRLSVVGVQHNINDASLSNGVIQITNGGTGYTNTANITVTISAPTRSGGVTATAVANSLLNGAITTLAIVGAGSGYIETPTITITGGGGANATANIVGETSKTGGNSLARYITRKVTLEQGFDATDLQVFLTANKQVGCDIQVYYKVMSQQDPDQNFDNKFWTRMRLATNASVFSANELDYIEYKYVPAGALTVPTTPISYTNGAATYTNFRIFAIKICMFSTSTVVIPSIRDMRGIALA